VLLGRLAGLSRAGHLPGEGIDRRHDRLPPL